MKKFLGFLIAALFLAIVPAKAQNQPVYLPNAATVNADTDAGQHYFATILTGNITTFGFTSTAPQQSEVVYVAFTQDGTGSRTVGFATNIVGSPSITSTANKTTFVMFVYDVTTQDWFALVVAHN